MTRGSNIIQLLGQDSYNKIRNTRCLLVGAGGIGSELLKDLILMEMGEIHIVDLDTIDLSNLNRQFLFRQHDIKKPKSTTAVKAVEPFSNSKLIPYQGNVMDITQFPLHWFNQFDIIYNALDNLAARRYVNKISQFLKKPLIESGTAGFDGYIQPIIPTITECFDCTTKETPKTFPVCTIRSTPSMPIHCIVWAKNFLFNSLFAELESVCEKNEDKDWGTDDKEEIERIKAETNELHDLQKIVRNKNEDEIKLILEKLFIKDIEKLLKIDNLWKTREKPTPLTSELINNYDTNVNEEDTNKIWEISTVIEQFHLATKKLINRLANEGTIEFDKDDADTLLFVATAANIRSFIFHIPLKSVFDIKQIAGNIIPAIASTNAIIAGLSSLVSLRVLRLIESVKNEDLLDINMAFTSKASNMSQNRYLSNPTLAKPNCKCAVCSKVMRGVIYMNKTELNKMTIGNLINLLREKYDYPEDISLIDTNEQRILMDYDFTDLEDKTLEEMKLGEGSILLFSDEEGDDETQLCKKPIELYLSIDDDKVFELPDLVVPLIKMEEEVEKEQQEENNDTANTNDAIEEIVVLDEEEEEQETEPLENIIEDENLKREFENTENTSRAVKKSKVEENVIELD